MSARLVVLLAVVLAAPAAAQQVPTHRPPPADTQAVPQRPAATDTPAVELPPRTSGAERVRRGVGIGGILSEIPKVVRPRDQGSRVAVPDLRGASAEGARAVLARSGLVLGEVDELPVAGREAGTVWLQRPAPGVVVPRGSAVSVMLAAAPAPVTASARPAAGTVSTDAIGDAGRGSVGSASPVPTPPVARESTPRPVAQPSPPPAPAAGSTVVAQSMPGAESMRGAESTIPDAESTLEAASTLDAGATPVAESTPPAPPAAPAPAPQNRRQAPPDVAVAEPETARSLLPWLLALLALAALASLKRLRSTPPATAVRARTRPGAPPRVAVDGAPFSGPALRLRRPPAEPAVSAHGSPFPTRP